MWRRKNIKTGKRGGMYVISKGKKQYLTKQEIQIVMNADETFRKKTKKRDPRDHRNWGCVC